MAYYCSNHIILFVNHTCEGDGHGFPVWTALTFTPPPPALLAAFQSAHGSPMPKAKNGRYLEPRKNEENVIQQ